MDILNNVLKTIQQKLGKNTPTQDDRWQASVGDTVEVHYKIALKPKVERRLTAAEKQLLKQKLKQGMTMEQIQEQAIQTQVFKGVVVSIKGAKENRMLVVRKIGVHDVGVERGFPLYSPVVTKIKIIRRGHPRRARLYYLRQRVGKKRLYVRFRENNSRPL